MATSTRATSQAKNVSGQQSSPLVLVALIVAGMNLRTILLQVPPILPLIQHDFHLNYTATGFVTSLPPLILGSMAYPAALAIRRMGASLAMATGLAGMTLFSLLRALAPDAGWLFVLTALMSLAITLGQTAAPLLINDYFPRFIGQVTAAYSTGLMVGEVAAASATAPLILLSLAGGSWRGTFVFWCAPVALGLLLWLLAVPLRRAAPTHETLPSLGNGPAQISLRSWRVWQAGLLLGSSSLLFFGMGTWIPVYFHHLGRGDGTLALSVMSIAQLPASLALTAWGQHIAGRPIGFLAAGGLALVTMLAWFVAPVGWDVVLAGSIGLASAAIFILGLSLPSYLATGTGVAQASGIMLTISYTLAFVGPFVGGVLGDLTHRPIAVFIPMVLMSLAAVVLGATLPDLRHRPHAAAGS